MSDESIQYAPAPTGLVAFTSREGQRTMIALADEFKAMCAETAKRGKPWLVKIGPGYHARIEAWQYLGQRAGITARVVETRDVRHPVTGDYEGVTACAEAIILSTGQPVTRAECDCYADEAQKKHDGTMHRRWADPEGKPNRQAIKGMAQTRACSRALAGALRFLAEMAGVEGTPAEEMDGVTPDAPVKPPVQPPQRKSAPKPAPAKPAPAKAETPTADSDGSVEGLIQWVKGSKTAKGDDRWALQIGGHVLSTLSDTDASEAIAAQASDQPVRCVYKINGRYKNLVAIEALRDAAEPGLALDPGDDSYGNPGESKPSDGKF